MDSRIRSSHDGSGISMKMKLVGALSSVKRFLVLKYSLLYVCNLQTEPRRLCYQDLSYLRAWSDYLAYASGHATTCSGSLEAYRLANPLFSADESVYQPNATDFSLLSTHSSVDKVVIVATKVSGMSANYPIVLVDLAQPSGARMGHFWPWSNWSVGGRTSHSASLRGN